MFFEYIFNMYLGEIPFFPYLLTISWLKMMLYIINLPGTKAAWQGLIRQSITCFILTVINFEIILYKVVQQEIGLNSLIVVGFLTFGIKVTQVQFTGSNILPLVKN